MPSKQFTPDQSLSRQTQSTGKFQYVPLPKYGCSLSHVMYHQLVCLYLVIEIF